MRMVRLRVQARQQFRGLFLRRYLTLSGSSRRPEYLKRHGYNGGVEFVLREFRREDFDSLWRIEQECFAPAIAYSRLELAAYLRLRGAFTVVAELLRNETKRPGTEPGLVQAVPPEILGFLVAQAIRRGVGHILTIDVPAAH